MPYVDPSEAPNQRSVSLEQVRRDCGPPPWRTPLIATPALRVVLWAWEPGFRTVPHLHPRAEEAFLVLEGRAGFTIGDDAERIVGPGALLLAPRAVQHSIRVVGDEPFTMLIVLGPNEDAHDETVERIGGD